MVHRPWRGRTPDLRQLLMPINPVSSDNHPVQPLGGVADWGGQFTPSGLVRIIPFSPTVTHWAPSNARVDPRAARVRGAEPRSRFGRRECESDGRELVPYPKPSWVVVRGLFEEGLPAFDVPGRDA